MDFSSTLLVHILNNNVYCNSLLSQECSLYCFFFSFFEKSSYLNWMSSVKSWPTERFGFYHITVRMAGHSSAFTICSHVCKLHFIFWSWLAFFLKYFFLQISVLTWLTLWTHQTMTMTQFAFPLLRHVSLKLKQKHYI